MRKDTLHKSIMGHSVYSGDMPHFKSWIVKALLELNDFNGKKKYVSCLNPHSYVVAKNSVDFRCALTNSDLLLPDGIGIVIASIFLRERLKNRITGFDLFNAVSSELDAQKKFSVFFLGTDPATLDKICLQYSKDYPNVKIKGTFSPPYKLEFSQLDNTKIISEINKVKPDVLFVGLGAPKQELWIHKNINEISASLVLAVGAVFDYYSGNVKRPSKLVRIFGFEWLWRLSINPVRLWRRTMISTPTFLFDLIRFIFERK